MNGFNIFRPAPTDGWEDAAANTTVVLGSHRKNVGGMKSFCFVNIEYIYLFDLCLYQFLSKKTIGIGKMLTTSNKTVNATMNQLTSVERTYG